MDWRDLIRDKLVSAEEAVKVIKSGDRVVVPVTGEPLGLGMALCARHDELRDVQVFTTGANFEFPWFSADWEKAFQISLDAWIGPFARPIANERRADFSPRLWSFFHKPEDEQRPGIRGTDVLLIVLSPPNKHGFCSFGRAVWHKKDLARRAKIVIAEIDPDYIWTYGENFIHVSEVDLFVEAPPRERRERANIFIEAPPEVAAISRFVSDLVKDGDTLQIGHGTISAGIVRGGALDEKNDLGWHSETTPAGIVDLVKKGVFTGKRKTHHKGKMVASAFRGEDPIDAAYVDHNPMWELYGLSYTNDIPFIASHDNQVAINNALAVDLTGQIASESLGAGVYAGPGGQPEFAIGSVLSKGGRSITVLPATARKGAVSRIAPILAPGTAVTVSRHFADIIVTEYGVAHLLGKSQRERVEEIIAIAHPDFRAELHSEAQKLYYP